MNAEKEYQQICKLLERYFDALYECDSEKLSQVLHERALYACLEKGKLLSRTMQEYFSIVDHRVSPKEKNERRRDKVISIDLGNKTTALAKVNCSIGEKFYTDYLSLLKIDNRWWIISKIFDYKILTKE